MDKTALRDQMIERRAALDGDAVRHLSTSIARRVQSAIDWVSVRNVHLYRSNPAWNEVDTAPIAEHITAAWPHVTLTMGSAIRTAPVPSERYDLIVVPLLAFDIQLNRLGFGGGWYDRFLASQPDCLKLGVAYDIQCVPRLPYEPHDIPLDLIVTESQTFKR